MRACLSICAAACLAACANLPLAPKPQAPEPVAAASSDMTRPQARPDTLDTTARPAPPPPPPQARTAEQFDTTTAAERAEAASAPEEPAGERRLGQTVASLGDVARPGFWLETPLVSTATTGRVVYPATGKSAQVDLIPIDGPPTAGSRISLAAMRLIEAPLTDLPTIDVFTGG